MGLVRGPTAQQLGRRRELLPGCQVWGVLNVTPDSFSDGGRFLSPADAIARGRSLLSDGADVVDVGGASSRPRGKLYGQGAVEVPVEQEIARVQPVVEALASGQSARVSIDTVQPEVAEVAIAAGARIVNDVSCGANPELLAVAAEHEVEYVLMHTRGRGEVRPPNTDYTDLVAEVVSELMDAVGRAERAGVPRARLFIDPGIGFAKTAEQSVALLAHLDALVATGLRVVCGPSRKGFIAETAKLPSGALPLPAQREAGTAVAVMAAVQAGVQAVRVHDVAQGRQAVLLSRALLRAGSAAC